MRPNYINIAANSKGRIIAFKAFALLKTSFFIGPDVRRDGSAERIFQSKNLEDTFKICSNLELVALTHKKTSGKSERERRKSAEKEPACRQRGAECKSL